MRFESLNIKVLVFLSLLFYFQACNDETEEVIEGAIIIITQDGKTIEEGGINGNGIYIADDICSKLHTITIEKDRHETKIFEWNVTNL